MEKLVEICDISVQKQDKKILEDVSLDIFEGEKVLIQGDSGSGKSTLLKAILFFEYFCSGEIKFEGKIIDEGNIGAYRLNFSFLPQKLPYYYETVKDFLLLPLKYRNNKNLVITENSISSYFQMFNLKESMLTKDYNKLSDGEKQRVCMIQSLLLNRKVMLLDEITSNLDKKNSINVVKQITGNKEKTAIIVSHDHLWVDHCDRKISIENGRISEVQTL